MPRNEHSFEEPLRGLAASLGCVPSRGWWHPTLLWPVTVRVLVLLSCRGRLFLVRAMGRGLLGLCGEGGVA